MAQFTEITFGDLQKEQRYQKLQRNLKLQSLKTTDTATISDRESTTVATWPSLSSINIDSCDPNSTIRSLQSSRIGSEVISSSNNLRSWMLKSKHFHSNQEYIATSSMKKYPINQYNIDDRDIMPPPSINKVPQGHRKKSIANELHKNINDQVSVSKECNEMMQQPAAKDFKVNGGSISHMSATETPKKTVRTFSRWRVMLNNEGQLIIKGTLECGKIARSKSVIRRLTSKSVESIYKHTYYLQGNIVDERHELPEYVRGKFYSGFPDDWENVYQIWRSFVAQNCKITFRWPTPITDSDDDLKSEMTDITTAYRGSRTVKALQSETNAKTFVSPTEEYRPCTRQSIQRECENTHCCFFNTSDSVKHDLSTSSLKREIKIPDNNLSNKENNKELQNTSWASIPRQTSKLKDIIREEKLDIIIENLTNKNCPQIYIDKVVEMFDCMNYVVSYRSTTESDYDLHHSNMQTSSKSREDDQKNNSQDVSAISEKNHVERSNQGAVPKSKEIQRSGRAISNYESSDNSESETYAGIPKISVARLMQKRAAVSRSPKRRKRYKSISTNMEKQVEQTSRPTQTSSPDVDSSISITEDEVELPNTAKHCYTEKCVHRNPFDRQLLEYQQYATHSRYQNFTPSYMEEVKRETKDAEHTNNTKEPFQFLNTKPTHYEDNKLKYQKETVTCEMPNNLQDNVQAQTLNQKSKPTVINSVPLNDVNVRILKQGTECQHPCMSDVTFEDNDDKDCVSVDHIEKPVNEDSKHTLSPHNRKLMPVAKVIKSPDLNLSLHDKRQSATIEAEPENKLRNTSKPPNLRTIKKKDAEPVRTPQLLTAWTPNVIESSQGDSALNLVFEGKLLNEAGHVVHRKFTTGIIRNRISADLVETVNRELYRLVGNVYDAKHVIPKELMKHCRNGCPTRIDQFCKMWKMPQRGDTPKSLEKIHDTTMDSLSVPKSSRGRRILPPLNYWTGERVTVKDNDVVYSPGHSQESTISSTYDSPEKNSKTVEQKRQVTSKKQSKKEKRAERKVEEPKAISASKTTDKTTYIQTNGEDDQTKKSPSNKRRIAQQLKFSSTDESNDEENMERPRRNVRSSRATESTSKTRRFTSKLRKRLKMENGNEKMTDENTHKVSPRKSQRVTCVYYRNIPGKDSALSDAVSEF